MQFLVTDVFAFPSLPMPVALRGSPLENITPIVGMTLEGPHGLSAVVASVEPAPLDDDQPGEPFSGFDLLLSGPRVDDLHLWLDALGVREPLIVELCTT